MSEKIQSRTAFEAAHDKRRAVTAAEAAGELVDGMAVRLVILARVRAGELTIADAQAELRKLQAGAKAAGKATRAQVFLRG